MTYYLVISESPWIQGDFTGLYVKGIVRYIYSTRRLCHNSYCPLTVSIVLNSHRVTRMTNLKKRGHRVGNYQRWKPEIVLRQSDARDVGRVPRQELGIPVNLHITHCIHLSGNLVKARNGDEIILDGDCNIFSLNKSRENTSIIGLERFGFKPRSEFLRGVGGNKAKKTHGN